MTKAKTQYQEQLNNLPATYPQLAMRTNKPGNEMTMDSKLWKSLNTSHAAIMEGCYKADRLKASLVYGAKNKEFGYSAFPDMPRPLKPYELEMLHAILGIISEGGELLEMFMDRVSTGRCVDRVNGVEEAGDVQWFLQLLLKSLRSTQEEAMHMNIEKLHKRFGEKYSDLAGLVRDQESERELLETIAKEQESKK